MAKRQSGSRTAQQASAHPQRPRYPKWSEAESRVADRFARAIVSGWYPNVNQALPDCRRELAHVTRGLQRTDDAVAWKLLCRAYDFGLPRRMHFWTNQERRLLERHASALARGECPKSSAAVREVKRTFERAGLEVRHPDSAIRDLLNVRSRALGRPWYLVPFSPEENRVIDRFSRALARNEYPHGTAAVADCRRALDRAGITRRRTDVAIANRINDGARALGRVSKFAPWSASGARIIDRFTRALVSDRYPTIVAASRACRSALERAGQLGNRTEGGLRAKLRIQAIRMGRSIFWPRWSDAELRILNRFARAVIRGAYANAKVAAVPCRRALERAGLPGHARVRAVEDRLCRLAFELRHKRQP
ncbi:MAG: hypothetical protein NTX53_00185 [candidate division WOR-3 bacterium]|nr:hypothetical protein [candidate division WOR-3 bacterium]